MKRPFIEYFIMRVSTLQRITEDLEMILTDGATLQYLGLPENLGFLRSVPVCLYSGTTGRPGFLVKRKDTGKTEDWLEDFELEPDPRWELMILINRIRAARAKGGKIVRSFPGLAEPWRLA